MKRLTTDTPKDNLEAALNLFYIKDHETWVRGGGPGPEYADVSLFSFIRDVVKTHIQDVELPEDDDDLSNMMPEWLMDGIDSAEGIVALLYTAAWAYAELRHKLMRYEDTGLEPDVCAEYKKFEDEAVSKGVPFKRIIELMNAQQEGKLIVLPCKVGDRVWVTRAYGKPFDAPREGHVRKFVVHDDELKSLLKEGGYKGAKRVQSEYFSDVFNVVDNPDNAITVLQMVVCGDMEVLAECVYTKDYEPTIEKPDVGMPER